MCFQLKSEKTSTPLFIVGNGFDLHHGIESRYKDFKKYAWRHTDGNGYYLGALETCYPIKEDKSDELLLWCDLEKALGEPDVRAIFVEATQDIEPEEDHEIRYQAQMEDETPFLLRPMFDTLHSVFEKWVKSLDINVEPDESIPYFDRNGLFLQFNYTETLETVYKIDKSRITYIHGRRNTKDELVLGHCENIIGRDYLSDDPMIYEYQAFDSIAEAINEQRKQVSDIIIQHKDFWQSLHQIDRVVIYGHSLSKVDTPYLKEICYKVQPDSEWYFSLHYSNESEKHSELIKVENFIREMNLERELCHTFPF